MKELVLRVDQSLTAAVQTLPIWLHPFMTAMTFLAYPAVLVPLLLSGIIYFYHKQNHILALSLFAALCSLGVNSLLKIFLHRPRPDTLYVGAMKFKTFSFPSGHAFGAMVVYGLLTYLLYRFLPAPWNMVALIIGAFTVFAIGVSRIYLGAHFPTDVIGGWVLGGITLGFIIYFLRPAL